MNIINKTNKKHYLIIIALSLLFILLGTNNANAKGKAVIDEGMNVTIPTEININFDNNGKAFVSDFNIQNNWGATVHLDTLDVTSKNSWNLVPWNTANRNEKDLSIKVNNKDINLNSQSIGLDILSKEVKRLDISVKDKVFKNKIPTESAYNFNMNFSFDNINKTYELVDGETFRNIISNKSNATKIIFTDIKMPTIDVTEIIGLDADGDGGIVAWYDLNNNVYISTQKQGQKVVANENCKYMFYECTSLQSIDLSNFDTSNVTDMSFMFIRCDSLKKINLSSFNTLNVTEMDCMFEGCRLLQSMDLSSWNLQKIKSMKNIFQYCDNLNEIYTPKNIPANVSASLNKIFYDAQTGEIYIKLPTENTESIHLVAKKTTINYTNTNCKLLEGAEYDMNKITHLTNNEIDSLPLVDNIYYYEEFELLKEILSTNNIKINNEKKYNLETPFIFSKTGEEFADNELNDNNEYTINCSIPVMPYNLGDFYLINISNNNILEGYIEKRLIRPTAVDYETKKIEYSIPQEQICDTFVLVYTE